ncbi:uncharacterized protein [Arachis hypogaea]|uniref:uncharacterized protein n=1 Tax=Arachis hypogaea TaxID=3818 RepID=UPI003B20F679
MLMKCLPSLRQNGRELVAQSCRIDGLIKKRRSICNFLVNSPKGKILLYSLDTSDISKTTDKAVKMLEDAVEFVGEENVVQIVTDNAANYKAAGGKMMETRKSLYWTPYAAHCINLILADFEKKLKTTKVALTPEGIRVQNMALDSRLWKNIVICLKATAPLITILRLVDSDEKPAMGFIFEGMRKAKETIKTNFGCVKKSYEPIWKIIDGRWESQLHRPLHAPAYYLNPHYHYEPNFMVDDADIKIGLYSCLKKLVPNQEERKKVDLQLPDFHYARGLFGNETAKSSRKTMLPAEFIQREEIVHSDDKWITEDVNENIAESVEHSHLPTNDNTNDDPNSNEFAIPSMNSNEFNMGERGENEFIGDPQ